MYNMKAASAKRRMKLTCQWDGGLDSTVQELTCSGPCHRERSSNPHRMDVYSVKYKNWVRSSQNDLRI